MATYQVIRASTAMTETKATRKQWPAACDAFYAEVYSSIAGLGGLDTAWGNRTAHQASYDCDKSAPDIGYENTVRIRPGEDLYVILRRVG